MKCIMAIWILMTLIPTVVISTSKLSGRARVKRGLGARIGALKQKLRDGYHGGREVYVDLFHKDKLLENDDQTFAAAGIEKDEEIEYNLIPMNQILTISKEQQEDTKKAIRLLLLEYEWIEDRQIILDYVTTRSDKSLARLNVHFNDDFGLDLSEYVALVNDVPCPASERQAIMKFNLFCQWAISQLFDPLIFLKLWMNYKTGTNPNANEYFKELLENPIDWEYAAEVRRFIGAIFPFAPVKEGTSFFCSCSKCLLKETKQYPGIVYDDLVYDVDDE